MLCLNDINNKLLIMVRIIINNNYHFAQPICSILAFSNLLGFLGITDLKIEL